MSTPGGMRSLESFFGRPRAQPSTAPAQPQAALVVDSSSDGESGPVPATAPPRRPRISDSRGGGKSTPLTGAPSDRLSRFTATAATSTDAPALSARDEARRDKIRQRMIGFAGGDPAREKAQEALFLPDEDEEAEHGLKRSASPESGDSGPSKRRKGDAAEPSDEENKPSTSNLARFAARPARGTAVRSKPPARGKASGKAAKVIGPSGLPYTELEEQILDLKKRYPDMILMVELGYRYKFFGDDAKVASKLLNVACFTDRNMTTAVVSPFKLHVHIRSLIYAGHKVGVVTQLETRALKAASSNASKLFERDVTAVYTASTWVDDMGFDEGGNKVSSEGQPAGTTARHSLVSIVERLAEGEENAEKTRIAIVANFVSTGEIVWDEFDDAGLRSELDTRLAHLSPLELLLPPKLTHRTEQVLKYYAERGTPDGQTVRVERIKEVPEYNAALTLAAETMSAGGGKGEQEGEGAAVVHALPRLTVQSLAVSIKHLRSFGLEALFQRAFRVRSFANRTMMLLTSGTLSNLEVLESSANGQTKASRVRGSLVWLVDRCRSGMGKRRLREWLSRPLCDLVELEARADAVQEIANKMDSSATLTNALDLLTGLPDLEKGLARVSYGRAPPAELVRLLLALHRVATKFPFASADQVPLDTPSLKESIFQLSKPAHVVDRALKALNVSVALKSDKVDLFNWEYAPSVMTDIGEELVETQALLKANDRDLDEHLKELRGILKRPSLQYATCADKEYLIEVSKAYVNRVPATWSRINGTAKVVRFQTPRILELLHVRNQLKETLIDQANTAYKLFITDLTGNAETFVALRDSVQALARLDALSSLARLSSLPGWSRPTMVPSTEEQPSTLRLKNFRHPMSEALMDNEYVPNSIQLGGGSGDSDALVGEGIKALLITGSNMGGKSSTVRAMALCVLLAQVGAAVPAEGAEISLFDSILTRMGASDDLAAGRSTFQTELEETGEILRTATNRSLVILDELGRGTSTDDGMAIAFATLKYLMTLPREQCPMTLFITHYFPLGQLQDDPDTLGRIRNMHMSYHHIRPVDVPPNEGKTSTGTEYVPGSQLVFLYKLRPGLASGSFGIHCAAAAGLPLPLLLLAQEQASSMQARATQRQRRQLAYDSLRQIHDALA